jgi:hypothetical protein
MRASNKIRFIRAVISGELVLSNRKRADIEGDLEAQGFDKMAKSKDVSGVVGAGCIGVHVLQPLCDTSALAFRKAGYS